MIILDEDFTCYPSRTLNEELWLRNTGGFGFGNRELQYYTTSDKNLFIDKEGLHIKAYKEDFDKNHYTSSKITSKVLFKYGKISFDIKLPTKYGTWPAIWMLSEEIISKRNWPSCGEIDLMEAIGKMPKKVHFSLHSGKYNHKLNNHRTKIIDLNDNEFHHFEVLWNYSGFKMMIDNETYELFNRPIEDDHESWPFDDRYFLIINLAIGGYFPDDPKEDFDEDEFIIKRIKVESLDD